jgi:hypothetical protein
MTTAVSTQHRFSQPTALIAAAATAVIVGGAAVVGIALSQDDTAAPIAPARAPDACQVNACMPHDGGGKGDVKPNRGDYAAPPQGGAGNVTPNRGDYAAPPQGGHVVIGLT